jgi:putative ABC transport system ATP-binding protein
MITLRNIAKEYRDGDVSTQALADITFSITPGEFVSIMGPSGSGKSTLLHILSFLDRPTSGEYSFFGKTITDLTDTQLARVRNQEMGFIFQSFNLLSNSTVYRNVELPLLYSGTIHPEQRARKVAQAVASVGLSEKLLTPAGKLSGGQKQRVAIARALVNDPTVIFADEPTGNLDSVSGAQVMEILKKLNDKGHTIILVTHETYTANFGNRLLRIKDGLLESDTPIKKSVATENHTYFK